MTNQRFKYQTQKYTRKPDAVIHRRGEQQEKLIFDLSQYPTTTHNIDFFYSPNCKHCMRVLHALEPFVKANQKINFRRIDSTSEENMNLLETWLKGNLAVPVAVIDNLFVITEDTHFLPRLMYALQITKNMPVLQEETQSCLLKK